MTRGLRGLLGALFCLFLALVPPLDSARGASQSGRIVIALVQSRDLAPYQQALAGFQRALEAAGFKPSLATYDLKGDGEAAAGVVAQLRRTPPDLIFTLGSLATREVSKRVTDIPIVFSMVLDPASTGLAPAGRRSGVNLTGVSMDISPAQQLDALTAVLPRARRIGALYSPTESTAAVALTLEAARARGLTFIAEPVRSEKEVPQVVEALTGRVDVLLAMPDATVYTESSTRYILLHTLRQAVPFMGLLESFVRAGALMGLALDYEDLGRQAGELAVRVQHGEAAGQIAVQEPRRTTLILNLRTARRIAVSIPPNVAKTAEVLVP